MSLKSMSVALAAITVVTGACASMKTTDNSPVVAVVNQKNITYNELKQQFERNSYRDTDTTDQVGAHREFLALYTDYRVKLEAAKEAGLLTDAALLAELSEYENQTAYPYWMENRIKDRLLNDFIERSRQEIHATHILISLTDNAPPADTLRVYERLMEARAKALAGADFDSLSVAYSSMQQGRSMGGDLGYFSVGWAVKPFEDAAYATPVGQISLPFRTRFGYHVIKVLDRRPATPDRLVSHIFFGSSQDEAAIAQAMEAANEVYDLLQGGADFAQMAAEHSQDEQSAPMAGQIGWVNNNRYLPTFTQPVMSHSTDGRYSAPFYSGYGVHIIRIDSVRKYPSPEVERMELLGRLQQLPHYKDSKAATIQQARTVSKETIHSKAFDAFEILINANRGSSYSNLAFPQAIRSTPAYSISGKNFTLSDYFDWMLTVVDTTTTNSYSVALRERFFNEMTDRNIIAITKTEFPAFAELSNNYLSGLAIFKISEDSIWNYAKNDTNAVRALYETQREKYAFEQRYIYERFSASNDSTLAVARSLMLSGMPTDSIRVKVAGIIIREDAVTTLEGEPHAALVGVGQSELTDNFTFRGRPTFLYLKKIDPARPMTFEEAYFRVVTDYQPIRERLWLDGLRARYNVVVYPDRIN
jgi:peptidyl-prolyl cis-trans isomerase SurA